MNNELWEKFTEWGSGFRIEAERDYKIKNEPLVFHLFMYGIHYKEDYEIIGYDLEKLLKQAIRDGEKSMSNFKNSNKE